MEIIFQSPKLNFYMWPWCHIPIEDMATSHLVTKSFHIPLGQEMLSREALSETREAVLHRRPQEFAFVKRTLQLAGRVARGSPGQCL